MAESESSVQSNVKGKKDLTWGHVKKATENGKEVLICHYCDKIFRGGGINRVKQHLAGRKGEATTCKKVTSEVRFLMQGLLIENEQKAKDKATGIGSVNILDEDEEDAELRFVKARVDNKGKRKASTSSHPLFSRGINDPSQPSIKATLQTKKKLFDVDLFVAMFFYHNCIPINACNSRYFHDMVDQIANIGHGYKPPSYHKLRLPLLVEAKKQVSLLLDSYRSQWVESGCTIMSDGWRDIRQRHLINFLVYCPKGISFIKSVDASDVESNASNLCNLFSEIVEMVGSKNVVQMITDNAANYKYAGKLLEAKYPSITWSPCAAHCLNLVLKDIAELDNVASLVILASRVTVYIYNHKWPLNWLRKKAGWKEIIRPGVTRFGTAFIALKSLVDHKADLQAMVISNDYKKMLKVGKGMEKILS